MPRTPDRAPRRDAALNRELLIQSAMEALREDPDASLDAIAAKAGLSRRSVYGHFAGRDDLFGAVVERGAARLAAGITGAVTPGADAPLALAALGAEIWAQVAPIKAIAAVALSGPHLPAVSAALAPVRATLLATIEKGIASGAFASDIPAPALAAIIEDLAIAVLDAAGRGEIDDTTALDAIVLTILGAAGIGRADARTVLARFHRPSIERTAS